MHDDTHPFAVAADLLATNAIFEAARRGDSGPALRRLGEELTLLSQSFKHQCRARPGANAVASREEIRRIERRISAIRENQCEIAGLADRIAATARRMTRALHVGGTLSRVLDYSKARADRLRALVTGIEMQHDSLRVSLSADRDRTLSLEGLLAAGAAEREDKLLRAYAAESGKSLDHGGHEMV